MISYRRQGIQTLFQYFFSSDSVVAKDFRREFLDFLSTKGRGKSEYNLKFNLFSGKGKPDLTFYSEFESIRLTEADYYLFADSAKEILRSYPTILMGGANELSYEDGLRNQQDNIIQLINYLKDLVTQNGKIRISAYKNFASGLGYWSTPLLHSERDPFMPSIKGNIAGHQRGEAYFEIDIASLSNFDFSNFLGCLLVEKYTFIVKTDGMQEEEMMFAFNLLEGMLKPPSLPSSQNPDHNTPPTITSYNPEFYKTSAQTNLVSIIEKFKQNLTGYAPVSKTTVNSVNNFLTACQSISFIRDSF